MNQEERESRTEKLHRIWWDFSNYMEKWYSDEDGVFAVEQMVGSEASDLVYEYAKTYPDIKIVSCDDRQFMNSDIVLIPHPEMGISVIYIPQCGTDRNRFFLYPGHIERLTKALEEMKEKYEIN